MTEAAHSQVVEYFEATRIVLGHCHALAEDAACRVVTAPLAEAGGRVLAEPLTADRDQPPFFRSLRDGFACRSVDWNSGGWLRIAGRIRAGRSWDRSVTQGEAIEIMTGAPVPPGADWVAMVEDAQIEAERVCRRPDAIAKAVPGGNLIEPGAEARRGDTVLPAGTTLDAARIGLAASVGAASLRVFVRPRVAILATGDELVELNEPLAIHKIRNSNTYSLAALVRAVGGEPLLQPIAPDDRGLLRKAIQVALEADLLLLTGGVSMGKYDFVEEALSELGATFFFRGVRIQPGKPVVFGRVPAGRTGKFFFGLPGNPVSAIVTFSLFAQPLLRALAGEPAVPPRFCGATLKAAVAAKPSLVRFLPARLETQFTEKGIEASVAPVPWRSSGDLAGAGRGNCFLMVPPAAAPLQPGAIVSVLLPAD